MTIDGVVRILLGQRPGDKTFGLRALEALIISSINNPPWDLEHGPYDILPFNSGKLQALLDMGYEHQSLSSKKFLSKTKFQEKNKPYLNTLD